MSALTILLYVVGWYAIGLLFVFLSCVIDYFYGDPYQVVTLDWLPAMLGVAILGPLTIFVPVLFIWDRAMKKILKGRDPKQIVLYKPRGSKQ